MRYLYLQLILLLILGFFQIKSQTSALNIRWDVNPEPDMYQYHLYRSVNSISNFQFLNFIIHPDSIYQDNQNIDPGNLYAYTLVAVDSAGNQSDFSDTVAVGLPRIDWSVTTLSNAETTQVNLMEILSDPDHYFSQLTFQVLNTTHIGYHQTPQMIYLFSDPPGYYGSASLSMKTLDPVGFWDSVSIAITIENELITSTTTPENNVPVTPKLYQNFPNPFNPITQIRYDIPRPGHVSIELSNILGERIRFIFQGWKEAGYHQTELNGSELAGGVYFVKLQTAEYQKIIKVFLLK
jgi:hypothetical protein